MRRLVEPPTARWRQVADRLRAEILADATASGRRLPSEYALAARFGVNRHTVRQAIRALAEEGLVRVEQGRGTFVTGLTVDYRLGRRPRFGANLRAVDRVPRREILGVDVPVEDARIAARLALAPQTPLLRVRSQGFADEVPLLLGSTWLEAARFAHAASALARDPSLTALYARHGITDYRRRSTRIYARLPTAVEARALAQATTRPVLVTEGLDVAGGEPERPLSWAIAVWSAERAHFTIEAEEGD
jgi:GntR family phosphonate transport system transcriptional regulator